jgi:hypothetical protein
MKTPPSKKLAVDVHVLAYERGDGHPFKLLRHHPGGKVVEHRLLDRRPGHPGERLVLVEHRAGDRGHALLRPSRGRVSITPLAGSENPDLGIEVVVQRDLSQLPDHPRTLELVAVALALHDGPQRTVATVDNDVAASLADALHQGHAIARTVGVLQLEAYARISNRRP